MTLEFPFLATGRESAVNSAPVETEQAADQRKKHTNICCSMTSLHASKYDISKERQSRPKSNKHPLQGHEYHRISNN